MRKIFVVLLSLGLLMFVGLSCDIGSKANVKMVGIGDDVKVGQAVWKVLDVEKTKQVGGQAGGGGAKAQGVFVFVEVQVKNTADEAFMLTGVEVEIVDEDNRSYAFDSQNNSIFLSSIGKDNFVKGSLQPGEVAKGWVIFDISEKAKGLKLKVRDLDILSDKYALVDLGL